MILSKFTELSDYHHNAILENFHHPPPHVQPIAVPTPSPKQPLIYFLSIGFVAGFLNNGLHDFTLFTTAGSHLNKCSKTTSRKLNNCFLNNKMSLINVISFLVFTKTDHMLCHKVISKGSYQKDHILGHNEIK